MSRRLPLAQVHARVKLAGRGVQMIGRFKGVGVKTQFKCDSGHIWEARPQNIMAGQGCGKCYNIAKPSIMRAAHARPDVRARYIAGMNRPEVRAKHRATMARADVKARHSAATKAAMSRPDVKAKHLAKCGWHMPRWYREHGHKKIWLYIVEFTYNEKPIQKVGITCDRKRRWRDLGECVQIIYTESGTPEYICQRERDIIRASRPYYANLPNDFDGHSECFTHVVVP